MKREALILALLLCQPAYAQNNVEDIGVKTGGYSTEEPQLKPALPEPVKKDPVMVPALETNKKEAAATQEDLLKMEREADVDFLFADTPERFISSQVSGTKFENCVLKQKWWTKLWLKIKNLMR